MATQPRIKVADIAYVEYRHPDLDLIERFLHDFGLERSARTSDALYLRGCDTPHHLYVAHRGTASEFLGFALRAASREDLDRIAAAPGASSVEAMDAPGGGHRVRLSDPNGFRVDVVYGMQQLPAIASRSPMPWNDIHNKRRRGQPQRPPVERAAIQRLGHIGLKVRNVEESYAWYSSHFGLLPSDVRYAETPDRRVGMFLRCDRGDEWVDHHTVVIFQGDPPKIHHTSFEVIDFDALRLGQEHMKQRGWTDNWGVGRHILGSQIFDYWRDPYGNIVEHFTDGDLLQAGTPTSMQKSGPGQNAVWSPPRPDWMNR